LIPESDFSESGDGERPKSPEIAIDSDISDEATPKTWPSYFPSLRPFTMNVSLNRKLFIVEDFHEHVCDQTNMYISQVITAASQPFQKH
jgi:hypothetical protein